MKTETRTEFINNWNKNKKKCFIPGDIVYQVPDLVNRFRDDSQKNSITEFVVHDAKRIKDKQNSQIEFRIHMREYKERLYDVVAESIIHKDDCEEFIEDYINLLHNDIEKEKNNVLNMIRAEEIMANRAEKVMEDRENKQQGGKL